jgi:fibronectin-binding autotransporter adhesin
VQDGIDARSGTALILQQLVSSGVITAGQAGIRAIDFNYVANAGAIVAGSDGIVLRTGNRIDNRAGATLNSGRIGISLSGSGNVVTNNGSITTSGATGDDGIRSSVNDLTVTNGATGRIDARLDGIDARSGTAAALPQQFLNSGVITAGQVGIRAIDFTAVTNAGGIAAGSDGIVLRAGNRVENQAGGTLMSGRIGVSLSGAGNTILNEGSITTAGALGDDGIRATVNDNSFTNASGGTISAVQDGIDARSGTAALPQQITNAGTIAAGQVGIRAIDFNAVTHSGTIAAGLDGIVLRTGNRVDLQSGSSLTSGRIGLSLSGSGNTILNEGAVATGGTLADDGIRATANDNGIANGAGGTITATQDGIDARSGTAANLQTLTNDGQIVAGQDGIRTQNFNRLTNTGRIAAGLDAVEIRADSVVVNATGGSLEAGRIGISVLGTGTSILNDGAIATSGPVGDDGIRATADRLTITNDGTISARIDGIEARSGTVAAHQQLRNGGTITAGQDGIRAVDFTDVTNDGSVTAGQDGIELRSNGAIVNGSAATIAATGNGARLTGSNSTILNLGLIASSTAAGVAITGGATNVVTNEGTIAGATFSVLGGNGADLVTSSGAFEGDVSLGNGADRLTLQDGALLDGAADGGAGVDAIVLDGSGTYAGAITRFETLTKTGAGAWRLTGGPSSVSATTIAAGELAIDGTLSTSMTVLPGGTLSGSGIIVGDVTSGGGTVSPGSPTGRLTVSGNYASDANSTFRAAIDDAGGGGSLSVAGTALLDGRLEIDPMPGDYSGGQVYDLLVAAGGVTGQFALVLVTQPLDFVLAYLADRVRLTTLRSDFTALAETPNQRAVAAYLDDINPPPGSDLETVFVELSTIPADELPDALDQLHPELYQAFDTASFASTRTLLGAADDRIALLGREAYGQTAAALDRIAFAAPISDVPMDPWSATAAAGAAWITASGGAIDQDDSGDHLGYDARSFDLVAGADAPLGHGLHAGILCALRHLDRL